MPRGHEMLHVPGQARLCSCDRAGLLAADLDCPRRRGSLHPASCRMPRAFPVAPLLGLLNSFKVFGTVFFLPSRTSLFQLRMTRNWSAPVCLPGSEESGSMRRSPIEFQDRRQVGGIAVRFVRVSGSLLPPVPFPDTCTQ